MTPSPHLPVRPEWDCAACRKTWPCRYLRAEIVVYFAKSGDLRGITEYLGQRFAEAIQDHPDRTALLYRELFGWLRTMLRTVRRQHRRTAGHRTVRRLTRYGRSPVR